MTFDLTELDAHEQPSEYMRGIWKRISKTPKEDLLSSGEIDDFNASGEKERLFEVAGTIPGDTVTSGFVKLGGPGSPHGDASILYHPLLPGLLIFPAILPPEVQKILLSKLIHRDLSVPTHQTNLHLHYDLPYPESAERGERNDGDRDDARSFFSYPPDSDVKFEPKDPEVHKPLSIKQVVERRLHWVTLGGQYDWTNRVYPDGAPPRFPADVAGFLETVFPDTLAQAAIVNFYTPGDTMMMHRDVSEETDKGLVSISLGCDALFMIAPNDAGKMAEEDRRAAEDRGDKLHLLLRLRSGDAIYMTKESRYAWHGVPKVLKGTCPDYLADWPAEDGKFEGWRGWMANKRINLNVRQMRD